MGLAQLSTLKKRCVRLKRINKMYRDNLKDVDQIKILDFSPDEVPLWTDALVTKKRDKLIDFLKKNNIECRKFWYPLHIQKPFKEPNNKYKNATEIYKNLFWLPSSLRLTDNDINRVCNLIRKFYKKN